MSESTIKIIGFVESSDGYHARLKTDQETWSAPIKGLALDDDVVNKLSPYDAFQLGFWLGIEVS